ncbi:hypothetical protein SSYRP_v1c04840 [Spiroplasma syrphidicola EA-1]|uniref:Uncharacterized protein n=1 Tax=Spiroplasma syrphidicola EA-1 TaxID=1276229 RepID=R4ULF1_9MOLU|nr:hypothetical protein [Spiroplasma syrphidicola]AGM26076.1 hypothetical protein SSYRP_v1c04840 [Spiroplasma syrphidicola EA-1]
MESWVVILISLFGGGGALTALIWLIIWCVRGWHKIKQEKEKTKQKQIEYNAKITIEQLRNDREKLKQQSITERIKMQVQDEKEKRREEIMRKYPNPHKYHETLRKGHKGTKTKK